MKNLSDLDYLKTFLRSYNLRPKDYLGQNFLADENALQKIIDAAELKSTDTVLEVGPGLGVLTRELAPRVRQVVAVEKDSNLVKMLNVELNNLNNLKIINSDILRFDVAKNISGEYKVVANIPYYLTSALVRLFLESDNKPERLVLMVQKEVGERIVAGPGELSILGISVQLWADAEIVAQVPRTSFHPAPEVDSVVIKITPCKKYPEITDEKLFFRILKIAFAGKRKQIHNTLTNGLHLDKEQVQELLTAAGIDGVMRPQDLSIEQWIEIYKNVKS